MSNLAFRGVTFDVQVQNNQIYLTSVQLAQALGYAQPNAVQKIYNRNKDEFTQEMSVTQFGSAGNDAARVFSLRGAHLVAMFSRTPIAKEFRRWVLDVLDKEANQQASAANTLPAVRSLTKEEQTAINMRAHVLAQERYREIRGELMSEYLAGRVDQLDKWKPEPASKKISELPFRPVSMSAHEQEVIESVFRSRRYLMYFDHDGKPVVYGLDNEQFITSSKKLARSIRDGGELFNSLEISEILQACAERLAHDLQKGRS